MSGHSKLISHLKVSPFAAEREAAAAIETLVAERDEAHALLQEARGYVAYWQYSGDSEHAHRFTRIDAVLAKTGRTG